MSARVLVVDDDGEMAELVAEHLVHRGYRADTAVGGKAAVGALKKKSYDAVVTDLRMEEVDGLDVLAAALSGDMEQAERTRTLEAFRLEGSRWLLLGAWREDAKVRVEPFDAFELDLASLWAK